MTYGIPLMRWIPENTSPLTARRHSGKFWKLMISVATTTTIQVLAPKIHPQCANQG